MSANFCRIGFPIDFCPPFMIVFSFSIMLIFIVKSNKMSPHQIPLESSSCSSLSQVILSWKAANQANQASPIQPQTFNYIHLLPFPPHKKKNLQKKHNSQISATIIQKNRIKKNIITYT